VPLEKIKTHILEDARRETERLLKATQEDLELKISRTRASLQKEVQKRLETLGGELQKEKERSLFRLQAHYNMELLRLKNKTIDAVFQDALEHILSLPEQDYLALLEGWLKKMEIPEKSELKLCDRDLRKVGPGLVRRINESAKKELLLLSHSPADIKGGFILRTKNFEIDRSLDALLSHLREEFTPFVAARLFG
jgi:V/A-type H+-transporting ATPase subunit E